MPEAIITFFGQKVKVACDGNCAKAWGVTSRPKGATKKYLSDAELGIAPAVSDTAEGNDMKPGSSAEFPNKWCVRQCERCAMSDPGKHDAPLALPRFNKKTI